MRRQKRLRSIENITESDEFAQFMEIRPQIIEFLSENFDTISNVPEVKNAVNLSNSVSNAFSFPKANSRAVRGRKLLYS